ncbi:MAG: NAD-dependent oxidoreductase [Parcubacteria bacterium C7867-003]|nr:MAG: NAD-dependent oxidoreductase [Parcubacteria bacterium C7867-003]
MKYIDNFLNGITMYKLVLYGLMVLSAISVVIGFMGLLPFGGLSLIYSLLVLGLVCSITNNIFAGIFKVQTNSESYLISALILFFVAFPIESMLDLKMLVLAGVVAMASKYILVWRKKHIFNPVAVSLVILALFGNGIGLWWVGSEAMLLPTAVLGFLVLRKLRRFSLFFTFVVVSVLSIVATALMNGNFNLDVLKQLVVSWPIIFFGSIMLTEPLTTPPTRKMQMWYGAIVGVFFGAQFHFGNIYSTPELALILGNIFSYIVSPRARLILTLKEKNKLTADVYDFVFSSSEKLKFNPGQYLEWTLGHKSPDIRGNRRYFTIASSPTEENIILGTKFYPNPSTFKQKLLALNPGDKLIASQLSGEFNMPTDTNKKLVFIAGGIGVTPFRSMAKYMLDTKEKRDIVFFYSNKTPADIAYRDIFDVANREVGWKNIYVVNESGTNTDLNNMRTGFITAEMIMKEVPDYKERMFYISGTHGMVSIFETTLQKIGVPSKNIKTDFFPGFV